jgi:uncharacterized phage protein (TIGR01671 family)
MRNIKFRAWDTITEQYIYAVPEVTQTILKWDNSNGSLKLQQYTGVKDNNGTEIYEGDIMAVADTDGNRHMEVVVFEDGVFGVHEDSDWPHADPVFLAVLIGSEVVGNIYENPELLK